MPWEQGTSTWSASRVERLRELWKKGLSASQIASRIGGITRNAVISKVHRLGLTGREPCKSPNSKRRQAIRRKRVLTPKRPVWAWKPSPVPIVKTYVPIDRADDVARVSSVADLETHHCRWPVGEPTQGFCGLQRHSGSSYCAGHMARSCSSAQFSLAVATAARIEVGDDTALAALREMEAA